MDGIFVSGGWRDPACCGIYNVAMVTQLRGSMLADSATALSLSYTTTYKTLGPLKRVDDELFDKSTSTIKPNEP